MASVVPPMNPQCPFQASYLMAIGTHISVIATVEDIT